MGVTMNLEDTWSWPDIPVDEVSREELETLFSFGHYDGPATGLIKWENQYWWAERFNGRNDDKYWIIELTKEEQELMFFYGSEWARLFHSGMRWKPDGTRWNVEAEIGIYGFKDKTYTGYDQEKYKEFNDKYKRPQPKKEAKVIGYFTGWRL